MEKEKVLDPAKTHLNYAWNNPRYPFKIPQVEMLESEQFLKVKSKYYF